MLGWRVAAGQTSDSVVDWIKQYLGWPVDLVRMIADLAGGGALFADIHAWLLGPALPLTAGVVALVKISLALCIRARGRSLIDYLWPSPPDILDSQLRRKGLSPLLAEAAGTPFLGREAEMQALQAFADDDPGAAPAFMVLSGNEGMGKTRLGLQWLGHLAGQGWDVGRLEPQATVLDIKRAHFRRRTAIVIDEPANLWPVLAALVARQRRRLRILVIDQFVPPRPDSLAHDEAQRLDAAYRGRLRLAPLPLSALASLAPALPPAVLDQTDGRPLYALLGEDPTGEIARRGQKRVDLAGEGNARNALFLAALAGPMPHAARETIADTAIPLAVMARLFEGERDDVLRQVVPPLKPDIFANDIVLRCAAQMDVALMGRLVAGGIAANPVAVARRLASLWRHPLRGEAEVGIRQALIEDFDRLATDHVTTIQAEAARLSDEIYRVSRAIDDGGDHVAVLDGLLDDLTDLFAARPFDAGIWLDLIQALVNATLARANADRLEELARRAPELFAATRNQLLRRRFEIGEVWHGAAEAAAAAMAACGRGGRFEQMEAWALWLGELLAEPALARTRDIALLEIDAAQSAVLHYGRAGHPDDLLRWAGRVVDLVESDLLRDDVDARYYDVATAMCVNAAPLAPDRLDAVEWWTHRAMAAIEPPAFRADGGIRYTAVIALRNALACYGGAGCLDDFHRWERHFQALLADPLFGDDPRCRHQETQVVTLAIRCHAAAGQTAAVEQWGQRLDRLLADPARLPDSDTRPNHVASIDVAADYHSRQSRSAQAFEGWALRLDRLLADPAALGEVVVRLGELNVISSAIFLYHDLDRPADMARWVERLLSLCGQRLFREDADLCRRCGKLFMLMIWVHGQRGNVPAMREWADRLQDLVEQGAFRDDPDLNEALAGTARHGIHFYGAAGAFDDLEYWGRELARVVTNPVFRGKLAIWLFEARAASCALKHYRDADDSGPATIAWRRRLALAAQAWPQAAEIQEIAAEHNLAYVTQGREQPGC